MSIFKKIILLLLLSFSLYAGIPSVAISDDKNATTNSDITFTFIFDENVSGFISDDINVLNATKALFSVVNSSDVYSLVVTPDVNFEGNVTVSIDADVAQSVSSSEGNFAASATQSIDTLITLSLDVISGGYINASEKLSDVNLTGTTDAEVGESVSVTTSMNANTYSSTVQAGGIFSVILPSGDWVVDGNYSFTASVTDLAGNTATSTQTALLDATIATPVQPDLDIGSDLGVSNIDNITSDNTPTMTGTNSYAEDIVVSLYDGVNLVGTSTQTSSGSGFSVDSSTLSDGDHNLSFKITDLAGNESNASTALLVTIDSQAILSPSLDLSSSSDSTGENGTDSDDITNDNTPLIRVDLNSTGVADGDLLEIYADGGLNTTLTIDTTAVADGYVDTNLTLLADGSRSIIAKIIDIAGNESALSTPLNITVDRVAVVSLNVISGGYINAIERLSDVNLSGSSDIEVGHSISIVNSMNAVTYTGNILADGSFNIVVPSADWVASVNGSYDFNLSVQDIAGNIALSSQSVVLDTVIAQPLQPDLNASSDWGDLNDDNITSDNTPTIAGLNSYGESIFVTLFDANIAIGSSTQIDNTQSFDINSSSLSDGEHNLSIKITDLAGNESNASLPLTLTIDTNASITLDEISDNYLNIDERNSILEINGTVIGVEDDRNVSLNFLGNVYYTTTQSGRFGFSVPSSDMNTTLHGDNLGATANVEDLAGNFVNDYEDVTVDIESYITLDEISTNGIVENSETSNDLIVSGATDFEDGRNVIVILNGVEYTATASSGSFSISIPSAVVTALEDKTYTITTKSGQSDFSGNIAAVDSREFSLDFHGDTIESATAIALSLSTTTTISSNLSHLGDDMDWFRVYLNTNERGVLDVNTSDSNATVALYWLGGDIHTDNNSSAVSAIVEDGFYYIKVEAIDSNQSMEYNISTKFRPFEFEKDEDVKLPLRTLVESNVTTNISDMKLIGKYLYHDINEISVSRIDLTSSLISPVSSVVVDDAQKSIALEFEQLSSHTSNTTLYNYSIVNNNITLKEGLTTVVTLDMYEAESFVIYEDYLFTVSSNPTHGFNVYDISDDLNIKFLAHKTVAANDIAVNQKYAYLGTSSGLSIVDIQMDYADSMPTDLMILDSVALDSNISMNNYAGESDIDIFKVIVPKSGSLKFTADGMGVGNTLSIVLSKNIDFSSPLINTALLNSSTLDVNVTADTYYARVVGGTNVVDGKYNLSTIFTTTDTKIDRVLNYQSDINDINLTTPTASGVLINDSDIDLYKLYIPDSGFLEFNSTKTISLWSFESDPLSDFAKENNLSAGHIYSGIYYLKVSGLAGSYTLDINFTKEVADSDYIGFRDREIIIDDSDVNNLSKIVSFNISENSGELNIALAEVSKSAIDTYNLTQTVDTQVDITNLDMTNFATSLHYYDSASKNLVEISSVDSIRKTYLSYQRDNGYIYAVYRYGAEYKLQVMNISDDFSRPKIVSDITLSGGVDGDYRFEFSDTSLTLVSDTTTYDIDITDKTALNVISTTASGWSNSIDVNGVTYTPTALGLEIDSTDVVSTGGVEAVSVVEMDGYLYVATLGKGIFVYSLEDDAQNPTLVKDITVARDIVKMQAFGTKLFILSNASSGYDVNKLEVIDISKDYSDYKVGSVTIFNELNVSGSIDKRDIDYFNIVTNSTGDFSVSIDSNISEVNCTLSDANNSVVHSCNSTITNLKSGLYYIGVQNSDTTQVTPYTISTTLVYDDHLDSMRYDSNQPLQLLEDGSVANGEISTVGDLDYFMIVLDSKSIIDINITAGFETKIYYNGGDEVTVNSDGSYYVPIEGSYFIEVSNSTVAGEYSFDLSVVQNSEINFIDAVTDSESITNRELSLVSTNGDISSILAFGTHIYMSDSIDGFMVVDFSDATNPSIVGKYEASSAIQNVFIEGAYAYLAQQSGVEIVDISDRSAIKFVSRYDTTEIVHDIVLDSNRGRLYLANATNGAIALDISNPFEPILLQTMKDVSSDIVDIEIDDEYVFVADSTRGIEVFDEDGSALSSLSRAMIGIKKLVKKDDKLYALTSTALNVYEIDDLSFVASYSQFDTNINQIFLVENYLYAMGDTELYTLNIQDLSNITLKNQSDEIVLDIARSEYNLFYAKSNSLEILEAFPDYPDVFKDAQALEAFPLTQQGQILPTRASDRDLFKFSTTKSGKFSISSDLTTVDAKVSLYSSIDDGMEVAIAQSSVEDIDWSSITPLASDADSSSTDFNVSKTINSGTFYLVIEDSRVTQLGGYYQFSAQFDTSGDRYFDVNSSEIESVSTDGGIIKDSLFVGGGDIDFVDISVDVRSSVTFTHLGAIAPRVTLYYQDGTKILNSTVEDANEFTIEMNPGDYRLRVDAFEGSSVVDGEYEIALSSALVEDLIYENGLGENNIEDILDIKYLGNYIYVLTNSTLEKFTHLLVPKAKFDISYRVDESDENNNINDKLFIYNGTADTILSYITTTTIAGLQPIVSELGFNTYSSEDILTIANYSNPDTGIRVLPYLEVKYISENQILYMYDGSTLQVRSLKNADNNQMSSYPVESMSVEVVSSSDLTDTVYALSSSGGYLEILSVDTATNEISTLSNTYIGQEIGAMFVDEKNSLIYIGADKKLLCYDISDQTSPIFSHEYDFTTQQYDSTPSDIFKRDRRIYLILPSTGIIVLDEIDKQITLKTTILNLGQYVDDVFSMDHRTVNYTTLENGSKRLKIYFFEETFLDGETDGVYSAAKEGVLPKEGCFIATAAYGSYFEENVKVLREFRDDALLSNPLGREFVSIYYSYSPEIADAIAKNESAKVLVRVILTPIVYLIKYPLYIFAGILILLIVRREYNRRRGVTTI